MMQKHTTERTAKTNDDGTVADRTATIRAEETHMVATDPYDARRDGVDRLVQAIALIFGVVVALIAIRFVLLLFGANPNAGFTSFVYGITGPLVAPFEGVFGAPDTGVGVFDPASLVAIVVYSLVGWVVTAVIRLALGERRTGIHAHRRSVDREIH